MNFSGIGKEIAIIKDIPKFKKTIISVTNDEPDEIIEIRESLAIKEKVGSFQLIPDKNERFCMVCLGKNGSGKSYYIKSFVYEFKKIFPDVKIFLFSSKSSDKELDSIDGLKRIKIDDSIIEKPFKYELFKNTLSIFDDVDALDKKFKDAVYLLRDAILKNGRADMCHCICSNHALCDKNETKVLLNECYIITFFLQSYNRTMKYLLENYIGLDGRAIKILRKNKSRATAYINTFPSVIMQEKNMYTIPYLIGDD